MAEGLEVQRLPLAQLEPREVVDALGVLLARDHPLGRVGGFRGRLGNGPGLRVPGRVGGHRQLAGPRGQPPRVPDGDRGQPREPPVLERDLGVAQQDRPGVLAGVLDRLLGRVDVDRDDAAQSVGVASVEGAGALGPCCGLWRPLPGR